VTHIFDAGLLALFVLATSIWVGGLVVIGIVARVARSTLTPAASVTFFRGLGRTHGIVGSVALLVALITGGVLLRHHSWDGLLSATVVVAVALLAASVVGMLQARRMTVLRRALADRADDTQLLAQVGAGSRRALVLRGLITLLTLGLVILGAGLAT
jgi:uncharacterized membrane protein